MEGTKDFLTKSFCLLIAACIGYLANGSSRENEDLTVRKVFMGKSSGSFEPAPKSDASWSFRRTMFCKADHFSKRIRKKLKQTQTTMSDIN